MRPSVVARGGAVLLAVTLTVASVWWTTRDDVASVDRSAEGFVYATTLDDDARTFEGSPVSPTALTAAELTAMCWASDAFRAQRIIDAHVELLDDPGLVRSAELLSGPFADDDVALAAEAIATEHSGRGDDVVDRLRSTGAWSTEQLDRAREYLDARTERPTSPERFVVLRANQDLASVEIVRLAVGRTEFGGRSVVGPPLDPQLRRADGDELSFDGAALARSCRTG